MEDSSTGNCHSLTNVSKGGRDANIEVRLKQDKVRLLALGLDFAHS